ncbi:MAG: choice-of-anchor J domain-containing protein [Bacteroidales bacterium]|nr:choice-of-anchor J domain-containing protein [Bacteroidales bacterium]
MKKAFTLLAAVVVMAGASFAQTAHRHVPMTKSETIVPTFRALHVQSSANVKAAGDTISTFPWTEGFENGTPAGFSFVDADGDGNNWALYDFGTTGNGHNGSDMVAASASYINNVGAVTPDNWMILPAFEIPTDASEFNLSWFEKGQDADYAAEYYSVYVSTTGNAVSDFTTAALTSTATGDWVKKTVSLANYGGQTVFIAFRHHNVTDMFYLNIDDIRVGGAEAPEVTVSGPASVEINVPATFVATGATTFEWTVDGTVQSETGSSLTYTFTTSGSHTVVASATNSAGTGSNSFTVNVYDCSAAITAMPWEESFNGSIDCWSFYTADTIDHGFNISANGGYDDDYFLIGAYSDDVNTNQWAISPMITLPNDATDYILKYYVYMRNWEGVQTHYQILISTTGADTSDFTTILVDETGEGSGYVPRTAQLGTYAGETIRIAIHNITPVTGDAVSFDALYIGEPLAPDMSLAGPEEVIVGESYEWTATSDVNTIVWTVDGATVSETGATLNHTFTTAGNHTIVASATNSVGTSSDTMIVNAIQCDAHALPYTPDLANDVDLCWVNEGWSATDLDGVATIYSMSNLYGLFELNPDNWIYTPYLTMPAEGSYEIAWKVLPYEPQLPSDHYGVYVVKDGNATLLYEETLTANITNFSQRAVAIPESITGDFKIAFRHYETTGGFAILVSDIKVVAEGTTVGIDRANEANVSIYPNPASSMLRVEGEGIQQVEIIDVNGRVVMNTQAGIINVESLVSGVYMVRVVTNDGVSTQKIVKK